MNDREFKTEISSGLSGGYLLWGDEEYLKDHYLSSAVRSVVGDDDFSAVNLFECDAEDFDESFLFDAASAVPMMAQKCCAVCSVRFSELKESAKERVFEALSRAAENPSLVLLFTVPAGALDAGDLKKNRPSSDYTELTKFLKPVCFAPRNASTLKKWIARHFSNDGLFADDRTLSLIVDTVGEDMTCLSREIEKLTCYVLSQEKNTVTEDDVRAVCSGNGELDAFALSNAIVSGEREAALDAVRECRDKKQKPTAVISRITSEFVNMLTVSLYMKDGMTRDAIAQKTGIHQYRVGRYMESLRNTDHAAIRAVIDRCVEVDSALKSSGGGYELIERFICTIPAKKKTPYYR